VKENKTTNFDFIGSAKLFVGISVALVVISIGLLVSKGLNYGIDFAGGTEIQVRFSETVNTNQVREAVAGMGFSKAQVQSFAEGNEFVVRLPSAEGKSEKEINKENNATIQKAREGLSTQFSGAEIRRVDSVGPQIGSELKKNGVLAVLYALLLILIYVGLRFDYEFAPGAVVCLFHDAIITLGIFSLLGKEVNVQTLAAILTIIGYSLNDTIVNYDRIRENITNKISKNLKEVINISINETLSRTIWTSLTTMLAVVALYFVGKGVIADFAFTLGIGVIVGTYSSIYVASPIVLALSKKKA
tara:strand:- start:4449 stop:5354 length:906 start_codon:yes stop_codon:yes gene_type:complete